MSGSRTTDIIDRLCEETQGEAILYPNLEEALVGVCRRFNQPPVALYDYHKCIEILMRDQTDVEEEQAYLAAVEWFEFNVIGTWAGEYTPAFQVTEE